MSRRALAALVRKDLLLELRGREVVPAMVVFVLAAFVLFRFALGGDRLGGGVRAATGMLWVAVVFTAMLGAGPRVRAGARAPDLGRAAVVARRPRAIWLAKACSTLVFLLAMQVVALPLFWLFFLQEGAGPSVWALVAALLLADVGIASLGALLAGLASAEQRPRGAAAGALPALRGAARAGRRPGDGRHDSPANGHVRDG